VSLNGKELILGVTGSIAAYKAVFLLRELTRLGAGVTVVTTAHAREFIAPLTWRTLSGRPVLVDLFDPETPDAVEHVALAERAQAMLVAPATANILAKAAHGLADDFLTTLLLAARCPVLMAPAMDGAMWEHPAVVANVGALRDRGISVLEPDTGALASGLSGKGRLPEVDAIIEALLRLLAPRRDLAGEHLLVTSGPTREPIDPVRYLSNRSSGKMGHAIATAGLRRGARVTLVAGPTPLSPPPGAVYVPVETAEEMREAVLHHFGSATIVIKAAAVADYRVGHPSATKIKSKKDEGLTLELVPNPDILKEIAERRGARFIVGFAAETDDIRAHAAAKLRAKGVELLVVNDVSRVGIGFEADDNQVVLLDRWGGAVELPRMSKIEVADAVLDRVLALRATAAGAAPASDHVSR
jgi:phosphopantothenoylcysteine decarboxylase / phosphopantothenate---cysteine ligase